MQKARSSQKGSKNVRQEGKGNLPSSVAPHRQPKTLSKAAKKMAQIKRLNVFRGFCLDILNEVGGPLAERITALASENRWEEVASLVQPNPVLYRSPSDFARDYLAHGLLRKWQYLPILADRAGTCLAKWLSTERTCKETNSRLCRPRHPGPTDCDASRRFEAIIHIAKRKIQKVLGGDLDLNQIYDRMEFSGGASTRLTRDHGHPYYKFGVNGKPHVTRRAAILGLCVIWHTESWRQRMQESYGDDPYNWITIAEGSRFATVSKTALTDRPICIEPDLNMLMQKGVGKFIRERLRRFRIDLDDQTRNQLLAKAAAKHGVLATIDLSSASDSVSVELVRMLLPKDWFDLLMDLRSEVVILEDGKKHHLEKISSMGNGYTFELESLIFWALASATIESFDVFDKTVGVYGDDIVVSVHAAEHLIKVLELAGFQTNSDKTFVLGPFRESCGKHYFYEADVTPFYVKEQNGSIGDLYWLANSLRHWNLGVRTPTYEKIVKEIKRYEKPLIVPASAGLRAGLILPLWEARPVYCRVTCNWLYYHAAERRAKLHPEDSFAVLASLAGYTGPVGLVVETGRGKRVVKRAQTSSWPQVWSVPGTA